MKQIDKIYLQASGTLVPGFALVAVVAAIQGTKISYKDGGLIAAMLIGSMAGFFITKNILK